MSKFYSFCFIMILCCACNYTSAQISDGLYKALPDSLKPKHKNALTSGEKRGIVKNIGIILNVSTSTELESFVKDLRIEAEETKNTSIALKDFNAIALYYYNSFDDKNAICFHRKVIEYIAESKEYNHFLAFAYLGIATNYVNVSKNDSAIIYLQLAQTLSKAANDSDNLRKVYDCYNLLYYNLRLPEKAVYYCVQVRNITSSKKKWSIEYTQNIISTAGVYISCYAQTPKKAYADSIKILLSAVLEAKKNEPENWYAACYYYLAYLLYTQNKFEEAIPLFDSSLLPKYNQTCLYNGNYNYARYLFKAASLIKTGHYEQGKKILDTLSLPNNHVVNKTKHLMLYDYFSATGNWKNALEQYIQFRLYSDSMDLGKQKGRIFEAEQKYAVSEKEEQVKKLTQKNETQRKDRKIIILWSIGLLFLLCLIILFFFNLAKKRKHQAEIAMLEERRKTEHEIFLRELDAQLEREKAIDNLRQTISRDMHDGLSAGLIALRYYVNDMKLKTASGPQHELLEEVEGELNGIYLQARQYMHNLNKGIDEVSYDVCAYLKGLSSMSTSLKIQVEADYDQLYASITNIQHRNLFLLIKEAKCNVLKHAQATLLKIAVKINNLECDFIISDNGKGFCPEAIVNGIGLKSMQARIYQLDGAFNICQNQDGGISISGNFPLK